MKSAGLFKSFLAKYKNNLLFNRLVAVLSIDIFVKLSGIILLPIYLRLMTQDEYGLYGYLLSIILTFSVVLNFGLYIPLSKFYHDYESKDRGTLLFTIFCLLIIILSIVIFPIYFFRWDYAIVKILFKNHINYISYRWPVLLAIIVTICNFMLTNFFFTSEKITELKKYNIFRIICINVLAVAFLFFFKGTDSVRVRLETTYVVELILFLVFSYFFIRETDSTFSRRIAISSLKLALPVTISAMFGIVINFSDKFFLEKYGTFGNMSYYYLAISCASVIPLIFTSFQNAWLPLFLKEKDVRKNIEKTNRMLVRLFLILLVLSFCIIVFVKVILMLGIIQSKYNETIYILPIILVSQILAALVPLYSNYVVYFEKTHIASIIGFFLCCISFGLSLLLVPRFGVYGAALVSLICNACYFAVYFFTIRMYAKKRLATAYPIVDEQII